MFGLIVLAALGLRIYYSRFHIVMVPDYDGVDYIWLAQNFLSGGLFWTDFISPAFPVILGLFLPLFKDPQSAGMFVSALFGAGLCAGVYLLSTELFDRHVALLATFLTAIFGQLIIASTWVMSEMPFAFFLVTGLYAGAVFFRNGGLTPALFFGGLFGIAYLIRPEGFVIFCMSCTLLAGLRLVLVRRGGHKAFFSRLGLALAVFIFICAPWLVHLRSSLGHWTLSGKERYNLAVKQKDRRLDQKRGTLEYIADNRGALADKYRTNLVKMGRLIGSLYPTVLLALAVAGAAAGLSGYSKRRLGFFWLLPPLLFTFALPLFFIDRRILGPYYPYLLIWAAAGALFIEGRLMSHDALKPLLRLHPFALVLALAIGYHYITGLDSYFNSYKYARANRYYAGRYLEPGQWLNKHTLSGEQVVSRDPLQAFYASRRYIHLNNISPADVSALAAGRGIRYVVVDSVCLNKNPRLDNLLGPFIGISADVPGFRLAYSNLQSGVVIYEVVNAK